MGTDENDFRMNAWMARAHYAAGQHADTFYFADRAAQHEVPLGLYVAGVRHSTGQGGLNDPEKGAELLVASVAAGFTPAFHALAISLVNGTGGVADAGLAVDFLRLVIDEGFGPAVTTLGYTYFDSTYLAKDDVESQRLLRQGAEYGDAAAYVELGRYAENSIAGPTDPQAALALYAKAIELGDMEALVPLTQLCLDGRGVRKDAGMAGDLLLRAAASGDSKLGFCSSRSDAYVPRGRQHSPMARFRK